MRDFPNITPDDIRDWLSNKIIDKAQNGTAKGNELRHLRHMLRDLKKNIKKVEEKTGRDLNR